MNNFSKISLALLAGAAAGAIAGILLAPDKGVNTRKKIADKAKDIKESTTDKIRMGFQRANEMKEKFAKEAEEILA
jgi:gas vesicle protein